MPHLTMQASFLGGAMTKFVWRLAARFMVVLVAIQVGGAVYPALAVQATTEKVATSQKSEKPGATLLAHAAPVAPRDARHADSGASSPAPATASSQNPTIIMLLAGFGLMAFIARRRTRTAGDEER